MRKIDIQSTGIEPESAVESLASGPATPIDTYHRYYCGNMVYDGGEPRRLRLRGQDVFRRPTAIAQIIKMLKR